MANVLCKMGSYYMVWSTIVDAPTIVYLSRNQLMERFQELGFESFDKFERILNYVDKYRTTLKNKTSFKNLVKYNRSGPNERRLTYFEIYRAYCLRKEIDGWSPYK
jgi:hypothetical protein